MSGPKKNSYKGFDKEKKIPAAPNFPTPPPITFLVPYMKLRAALFCLS